MEKNQINEKYYKIDMQLWIITVAQDIVTISFEGGGLV